MQCPVDGATLLLSEREGVEIDYCPECRGVWLDRGELDKIIERTDSGPSDRRDRYRERHQDTYGHNYRRYPKKKKKKGLLGELFDFD